ncbi:uncharacterized protein EI90DRAFT_2526821 [Cantharellus anzutake]|uniref:uncharacterized protein n=1 Tax=Cantharellus anzutake TaxID=1750568 RepID=UPI001908E965|nr:uncharacterized protein EI90DRAFT_2526821 [Cantharellus anzutake]KAF8337978.1 hypothetical protein EI90DRAFT_2526821 [Cantharellus anzutake]
MLGINIVPFPLSPRDRFVLNNVGASKTKAIVLVTPNNLDGSVYPPGLLARFADLAKTHGICLLLDETYRDSLFLPILHRHPTIYFLPRISCISSYSRRVMPFLANDSEHRSPLIPFNGVGLDTATQIALSESDLLIKLRPCRCWRGDMDSYHQS